MPLQNHSKFCILKITLTILGETHSQIEHFVTVVLGRNSFTSQRSWSTDTQLQFILQRSHNCCVWQKQLYLSKILVNRQKTGLYSKEVTLWILTMHLFKIPSQIEHFVNVVFGKNSFTCQRSWSTNIKLVHTLKKSLCEF